MSKEMHAPYLYQSNRLCMNTGNSFIAVDEFVTKPYSKPIYLYNMDDIEKRVMALGEAFSGNISIHYALKANDHPYLIESMAKMGLGLDVVSSGEISKGISGGFLPTQIVFSGVGKTKRELMIALESGISQINVESPAELERVGQLARSLQVKARVAFRMNPDVNPVTHPYIRTGFRENKFGMDNSFLPQLEKILSTYAQEIQLMGLTLHIGSQLRDLDATTDAIEKTLRVYDNFVEKNYPLITFDIGGGLGIDYQSFDTASEYDLIREYGRKVKELVGSRNLKLVCEPGRILVGRSGILITEVQYIKSTPFKTFAVVDTGMHHLLRPSLYQAHHRILPLFVSQKTHKIYDVVGPICESADVIGYDRNLPELEEGDLLAVADVGAYGRVMASDYNSHERPTEIFVSGGEVVHRSE